MSGVESKAGKREGGEMEAFGKLQAEGKICFAATAVLLGEILCPIYPL